MFEQMLANLEERPAPASMPAIASVAVIGADPVGQAIACAALRAGCDVRLHSALGRESRSLTDADEVVIEGGALAGSYAVSAGAKEVRGAAIKVIVELDVAVNGVDAVILAVPRFAHTTYATLLAPILRAGQTVVLAPGGSFGALEVARAFRAQRTSDDVHVVELCDVPYLVSQPHPGRLVVEAEHGVVLAAAIDNAVTQKAAKALQNLFPMVRPASGVLQTSFANMAGLTVAAPALLAASAPSTATLRDRLPAALVDNVLPRLDQERRRTAHALGVRDLLTFPEWLEAVYGTTEKDTMNALDQVSAFGKVLTPLPGDPAVRDAVATALVPVASAGELVGVPTPVTSALVALASGLHGFDHTRHGRTMAALGLDRMRTDEIRRALDGADNVLAKEVLA
jgi:opine dehydrogenase